MTTMNKFLFSKDKHKVFENNQYTNLNLNQSNKCSILIPVNSCSKTFNNKFCESKNYEKKKKSESWNKSSQISNAFTFNNERDKKLWKKDDFSNQRSKNSTLSLHISAYENFLSETFASNINESDKKLDNSKRILNVSPPQNPFEFPRQQNDKIPIEPELSQFEATQRLLSPTEVTTDDQHRYVSQLLHQNFIDEDELRLPLPQVRNFSPDRNPIVPHERGHGLDIAIGTQSYNLVFIEVLRFEHRFFVSAFYDQTIAEVKKMLNDVIKPTGPASLYAFYPEANNFTVLKDDTTLAECGFRSTTFNQPGILYLCFGNENPRYTADPKNKPIPQPSSS